MSKFHEKNDKIKIATDLALESAELIINGKDESLEGKGVFMTTEQSTNFNIKITNVEIRSKEGEELMGRPAGSYITIESEAMKVNDVGAHEEITKILSGKISKMAKLRDDSKVLVAGLGNWHVTPDSLGPKVVSKTLVTRGMTNSLPKELKGALRSVCAITPGVMGITGIETAEIIKGACDHVKPDLVIAVDALAARCAGRINAAVQLADTGINPGAGMGNARKPFNEETLGVPVLALGVPTVVDAATLVNDTLDLLLDSMVKQADMGSQFYETLVSLSDEEKYDVIKSILDPYTGNMFVTPKDIGIPLYI